MFFLGSNGCSGMCTDDTKYFDTYGYENIYGIHEHL
jgi:hypothetical protein